MLSNYEEGKKREDVPLCPVIGFSFGHVVHGVMHTTAKRNFHLQTASCIWPQIDKSLESN